MAILLPSRRECTTFNRVAVVAKEIGALPVLADPVALQITDVLGERSGAVSGPTVSDYSSLYDDAAGSAGEPFGGPDKTSPAVGSSAAS
ncbi:hypothetical protein [Gymnodinialimonas phycosphaerae]|uniref:hypothetical protein n=1 Tax=Gymnodinialimonas phycosphaerae TaxID=2841589 RepID=UPI0031F4614C